MNFETGRRRADWDVAGDRFAPIYLDGRLFPLKGVRARFGLGVDPEKANVSEALVVVIMAGIRSRELSIRQV